MSESYNEFEYKTNIYTAFTKCIHFVIITVSPWPDKPKVSTDRCFWPFCMLVCLERYQ